MSADAPTNRPISRVRLLRARDADALADFYDGCSGRVNAYCAIVCPPAVVDEAVLATFVDFLSRVSDAGDSPDLEDLLIKAARNCCAIRLEVSAPRPGHERMLRRPTQPDLELCRAMPRMLAASANGELEQDPVELEKHVVKCATCRATATRLRHARRAFARAPGQEPAPYLRAEFLARAARASQAEPEPSRMAPAEPQAPAASDPGQAETL